MFRLLTCLLVVMLGCSFAKPSEIDDLTKALDGKTFAKAIKATAPEKAPMPKADDLCKCGGDPGKCTCLDCGCNGVNGSCRKAVWEKSGEYFYAYLGGRQIGFWHRTWRRPHRHILPLRGRRCEAVPDLDLPPGERPGMWDGPPEALAFDMPVAAPVCRT